MTGLNISHEIQSMLLALCDTVLGIFKQLEAEATTNRHPEGNFEQRFNALNKVVMKSLSHLNGHVLSIKVILEEIKDA